MKKQTGFTLIELMITIAVLGILVAIAYPSYTEQVRKTRRSDGQVALTTAAQQLERCFTQTNSYVGCAFTAASPEGWYNVASTAMTQTTYTLQATALNDQANDVCLNLTLTHTGQKASTSGRTDCW